MNIEQINNLVKNANAEEICTIPDWELIVERLSNQIAKESIDLCQQFINVYTDPENYANSWFFDSKIDAFKQMKREFERKYRNEQVIIKVEGNKP